MSLDPTTTYKGRENRELMRARGSITWPAPSMYKTSCGFLRPPNTIVLQETADQRPTYVTSTCASDQNGQQSLVRYIRSESNPKNNERF